MTASGGALDGDELPPIDVLIVVALEDELDAVLAEGSGTGGWRRAHDHVHVCTFANDAGQQLGVAAAWAGAMGTEAAATRAATLDFPEGDPDLPFQVHVGPIATGNAVIEDPEIFDRLKCVGRKTLGVEMEGFAIGYVGDPLPQRSIVVKAVSDHADHDKDDRFRPFACRASAAWQPGQGD